MCLARHVALFSLGKQSGIEKKDFGVLQMNLSAGPSKTVGAQVFDVWLELQDGSALYAECPGLISYADGVTRSVDFLPDNSPI